MTYKIKNKKLKEKNIDEGLLDLYAKDLLKENKSEKFEEQELALLRKKYKGKLPPFRELYRTSTRRLYNVPEKTHTKGNLVQFQEQPAIIDKVTKNGIYVRPVQTIDKPVSRKTYYISNEEVRTGKILPYITYQQL